MTPIPERSVVLIGTVTGTPPGPVCEVRTGVFTSGHIIGVGVAVGVAVGVDVGVVVGVAVAVAVGVSVGVAGGHDPSKVKFGPLLPLSVPLKTVIGAVPPWS